MDNAYFSQLLGMASEKQKAKTATSGSSSKFISTKVSSAKKESKPSSRLENNVKAFLERQEAEKKAEQKKAAERTKNLLELRKGNKDGSRAANRMLKMTKSANKSVLEEATSKTDTADTLAGRKQCDEALLDYESNAAKGFYEKLMSKYEANPEDPMAKFSKSKPKTATDMASTMARVKQRLMRGDSPPPKMTSSSSSRSSKGGRGRDDPEEEGITWGESSKKDSGSSSNHHSSSNSSRHSSEKPSKPREPPKPKKSFAELMAEAKQNAKNPKTVDEVFKSAKKAEVKECEYDRPMTDKEKAEYRREKQSQARREGKSQESTSSTNSSSKSSSSKPSSSRPMPASKKAEAEAKLQKAAKAGKESSSKSHSEGKSNKGQRSPSPPPAPPAPQAPGRVSGKLSQAQIDKLKSRGGVNMSAPKQQPRDPAKVEARAFPGERGYRESNGGGGSGGGDNRKQSGAAKPGSNKPVQPRAFPGERGYREPGSSSSRNNRERSESPEMGRGRKFNPEKMSNKRGGGRNRIESDDEEDEDSEMDDFIDDSEAKMDISAEIRSIFGYDRRRFRDEEPFDDRSMENNSFASQMKEEAYSARIGRQEDLEEERREQEELRRKMARKKMRR